MKKKGVIEQLEAFLQQATGELQIAKKQRKIAEDLLAQAKDPRKASQRGLILESAQIAVLEAEKTDSNLKSILQQAHDLVKDDEESPDRPFFNFKEIKELKEFRDIVNAEGEAAEEAYAARQALSEIENLT